MRQTISDGMSEADFVKLQSAILTWANEGQHEKFEGIGNDLVRLLATVVAMAAGTDDKYMAEAISGMAKSVDAYAKLYVRTLVESQAAVVVPETHRSEMSH